jgi:hypothetical protein
MAEFDQAVAGGAEGIEEDDEVQFERGADLAPNAACPITSKGVRHRHTLATVSHTHARVPVLQLQQMGIVRCAPCTKKFRKSPRYETE